MNLAAWRCLPRVLQDNFVEGCVCLSATGQCRELGQEVELQWSVAPLLIFVSLHEQAERRRLLLLL